MSGGIATIFAEENGKPTKLRTNTYLISQKTDGAMTKPDYYKKQRNNNAAIENMTIDFMRRGLKYSIFLSMGCTRDDVHSQHFVVKVVQFQQRTGAEIQVVTYDEKSC